MAKKKKQVTQERYKYKDCPEGLNEEVYLLIRRRRLQMLVHSHLYYRLDSNVLTDKQFDKMAYELRDIQKQYPAESEACDLAEDFKDWDGTTGFHLPYYPWVHDIAQTLLREVAKHEKP